MADVQIRKNEQDNRYEAVVGDEVAGFVDYRVDGDTVDLVHTEVDDAFEGQGVGSSLAQGALRDLAEQGTQVQASCPFIAGYIDKHPQIASLLSGAVADQGEPKGFGGGGSF